MSASIKAIDLRMEKVEVATRSIATYSDDYALDSVRLRSYLQKFIESNNDIVSNFIIYTEPAFNRDAYWAVFYYKTIQKSDSVSKMSKHINPIDPSNTNERWFDLQSINDSRWSVPYNVKGFHSLINFTVPLRKGSNGPIYAILGSEVSLLWVAEIVSGMKPDTICEIAIISSDGEYLYQSGNKHLHYRGGKRVYTKETPQLGWTVVFTYPNRALKNIVMPYILRTFLLGAFLIVILILSLLFCIKFVAHPYMEKFRETTQARATMEEELQIASSIQLGMLPKGIPDLKQHAIDLNAVLLPAKQIGGDLYDFVLRDDKLFFCIGDVSGKGIPAALFMSEVRSLFHTLSYRLNDPAEIVRGINLTRSDNNEQCMFCTLFMGVLDLRSHALSFCNAGHNLPIIITEDTAEWLPFESDRLLGVFSETIYQTNHYQLRPGSGLFLYTDGVTEAQNKENKMLGEDATLSTSMKLGNHLTAQKFTDGMLDAILHFTTDTEQSDDITMMYIKIND